MIKLMSERAVVRASLLTLVSLIGSRSMAAADVCMSVFEDHSPAAIFFNTVEKIDSRLDVLERPRSFRDRKASNEIRTDLFKLEGWARIHKAWPVPGEAEIFEGVWEKAKALEDVLGAIDTTKALTTEAVARGENDLARMLLDRDDEAFDEVKALLKEDEWFSDDNARTNKIRRKLNSVSWPSPETHYTFIAREFVRSIQEFDLDYASKMKPKMSLKKYDHKVLEDFVHDFRRKIRWYAIYLQSGEGYFALGSLPTSPSAAQAELIKVYKDSPYAQLPVKSHTRAKIEPTAYYELTRLIQKVGEIKDRGEMYFFMQEALVESGYTEAEATAQVKKWYGDVPNELPPLMHVLMAEYEKLEPLDQIRKDLEASLKTKRR